MQTKDFQPGGIPVDVAVFNQLVVDNQRLKLRVDALEKLFQDAQKEILTLQECMSTLIATELRTDGTELKNERCRSETVGSNRLLNVIPQFSRHAKCADATKNGDRNHREDGGHNLERRISLNEHRSTLEKRLNLHHRADDKYTTREYVEHPYKSREYLSKRSHKTTDRGSENSSRRNDNTDRSPYRRRADESRSSSILGRSQQLDFKYPKKRQIPEISTSKHYDKHDGDERSDNAIRSRDRVGDFSHEQRASLNRHELCNSDLSNLYRKSNNAEHRDRSSDRSSLQRYENRNADRNQRSSVVREGQQQNVKHLEERHRIIERPTFDERDRRDDNFERSYHLDQYNNNQFRDRSEHVTGSSITLNSRKPTESSLPQERNSIMTESPRNQRIVKRPLPINDNSSKNVNNSERPEKIIRDSETKEKFQYYLEDNRISSLTQKKTVSGTMEDAVLTRNRERSPRERNKTVDDDSSSSKITLWSDAGKVESNIGSEYLSRIYCTPMKFINDFKNHKILSPLQNTPNEPIDDSKEQRSVETRPVPLILDVTTQNEGNEPSRFTRVKPNLFEEVECTVCEPEDQTRITSGDSVEIQTVIKTDDAEHGVFKRRRRNF